MNRLLSSERSKWIFVIGLVAIGAGFTAKKVISFPTECVFGEEVEVSRLIQGRSQAPQIHRDN